MPLFVSVGKIYELRLMIEFSGTNRTYCYVRYCTENDAKEAVRRLHNYRIRPDYPLAVTISVDNRRPGVSKSRYFGISIPIKYSNFSRFYKKMGPFYKKFRCDKFGN